MNTFDLQMHSTASDGVLAPRELVRKARKFGIAVMALTDHDTVVGVKEAEAAGREFGVEVIPGIELSCGHGDLGLHILGYGVDIDNPNLLAASKKIKQLRIERAKEMVRRLKEEGFQIDYQSVERRASGGMVMRPHIAFEILENPVNHELLGGIKTKGEFIRNFLVSGKPAYVELEDLDSKASIELIHSAGGVAVWSHPAVHFSESFEGLEATLTELVTLGLDGVEVFNSSHTEAATRLLARLASSKKLLSTAGSDFEVEPPAGSPDVKPRSPGDYDTYGLSAGDIIPNLKLAIAARQNK